MTTMLVTRHKGAMNWLRDWARAKALTPTEFAHFDEVEVAGIKPGDTVAGPLPCQIIAAINARGGRYFHIEMTVPKKQRGQDHTKEEMDDYGARLVEYRAERIGTATE